MRDWLAGIGKRRLSQYHRDYLLYYADLVSYFASRLRLCLQTIFSRHTVAGLVLRIQGRRALFSRQGASRGIIALRTARPAPGRRAGLTPIAKLSLAPPPIWGRPAIWYPRYHQPRWARRAYAISENNLYCSDLGRVFFEDGRTILDAWHRRDTGVQLWRDALWGTAVASVAVQRGAVPRFDGLVVATQSNDSIYGHFIYEVLPRVSLLRRRLEQGACLYVSTRHSQYLEALGFLGIPETRIISSTQHAMVFGEEVHIPVYRYFSGMDILPTMVDMFGEIKRNALVNYSRDDGPQKIFLSRGGCRPRLHEDELLPLIKERGFEIVCPQRHPLAQQVAMFHHAEVVLGAHGSGMANLVFCRPGTKVIEMRPAANTTHTQAVAAAFGLDYRVVKANFGNRYQRSGKLRYPVARGDLLAALADC